MDAERPFCAKQARGRKLNEEVSQRRGVKDARIKQDRVTGRLNSPSPAPGTERQARPWLHGVSRRPVF
jgi:hypothetical protein